MVDLGENVGWIATTLGAGTVAVASWFLESGYLATIGGIIIGAGLTYFVEQRNQKRTWKREYALRSSVEVYGVLYNEFKSILMVLEEKWYRVESFTSWRQMQDDHRYFMVDQDFRKKLDIFAKDFESLSVTINKVRTEVIPKVISDATEILTGDKPITTPTFEVSYKKRNNDFSTRIRVEECLMKLSHPIKYAISSDTAKDVSNSKFIINYKTADDSGKAFITQKDLEEYWQAILTSFDADDTYRLMIKENERLLGEAKKLQKEIAQRIEEPWKI